MRKQLLFTFLFIYMCLLPFSQAHGKTAVTNVQIPVGSVYYAGKKATELSSNHTDIAAPFGENRVIAVKTGTAIIKYKKNGQVKKIRLSVKSPAGHRINRVSGQYDGAVTLKLKAKAGYTLYYTDKASPTKFYKVKSGTTKTINLEKTTTLRIQIFKNSKRKITKSYLLKNLNKSILYYYRISNPPQQDLSEHSNTDLHYDSDYDVASKTDLNTLVITLDQTEYDYDKELHIPSVTIQDGSYTLIEGKDYTLSCPSSVNSGVYYIFADGIGNYTGSLQLVYQIKTSLISWYEVLTNLGETLAENEFTYSNDGIKSSWSAALAAENKVCNCSAFICYALQIFEPTSQAGFKGQIYSDNQKPYGVHYKSGASLGSNIALIETDGKTPGELSSVLKEGDICMFWLVNRNVPHMAVYAGQNAKGNLIWYNGGKDAVSGKAVGGTYLSGKVGPTANKQELNTGKVLGILRIIDFGA